MKVCKVCKSNKVSKVSKVDKIHKIYKVCLFGLKTKSVHNLHKALLESCLLASALSAFTSLAFANNTALADNERERE